MTSTRNIGAICGGTGGEDVGVGSDSLVYDPPLREIRVGTAPGNVAVQFSNGSLMTFKNLAVGETRVAFITKVFATGTTATGIEGMI